MSIDVRIQMKGLLQKTCACTSMVGIVCTRFPQLAARPCLRVESTVYRLYGQTLENISGSDGPCRHKHVVPHESATYIKGSCPQA
jgi:hypothetical protein